MKKWYRSRTLWINFLLAMGVVLEANFGLLQALLGPKAYLAGMTVIAGGNFLLRFATTLPIVAPPPDTGATGE